MSKGRGNEQVSFKGCQKDKKGFWSQRHTKQEGVSIEKKRLTRVQKPSKHYHRDNLEAVNM